MERYKIIQCPKCGKVQVTTSVTTVKCKYCGRSSKIFSKKHIGTHIKVLHSTNNPKLAVRLTQEIKKRKNE